MKLRIVLLHTIVIWTFFSAAQHVPESNDTLHYKDVLFRFPWLDEALSYELKIYREKPTQPELELKSEANALVVKGLEFGRHYQWMYRGRKANGKYTEWSEPAAFYIAASDCVDSTLYRFRGKKYNRSRSTRGLLLCDYAHVAINRAGIPVWYLPHTDTLSAGKLVRDLKMTNRGTFTVLLGETAVELDRDGNELWRAPDDGRVSGEQTEGYHHEFTRLENGNYLVLGTDHAFRKLPESDDSVEVEFGTIIEYAPDSTIVWSWNSKDYFSEADLFSRPQRNGKYDLRTHMNAATTDGKLVFAGFRDLSRIVVIDKESRQVIESYGGYGVFSEPHAATGYFRRQHDALQLKDGNLAVLNNDSIMDPDVVSSVVIFSRSSTNSSQKLLDFKFDFDTLTSAKSPKTGNLNELENGNLLVNMGSINRCIELTREGEVVWDMFLEQRRSSSEQWQPCPQYRVHHAPSLYPFEFTARILSAKKAGKGSRIVVRVYNVGTETDTYSVSWYELGRKEVKLTIPSGGFKDVQISTGTWNALAVRVNALNSGKNEQLKSKSLDSE